MALSQLIQSTRRTVIIPRPEAPSSQEEKVLKFTMECQQANFWCWAAVAVSVARYYSPQSTVRQCTLASKVLELPTCCVENEQCLGNKHPADCDRQYSVHHPLKEVGHLGQAYPQPIDLMAVAGMPSVQEEIDYGRPVVCRIEWTGGSGHFIVIYGYDFREAAERLHLADSTGSTSIYDLAALRTQYMLKGVWEQTYTTKP